MRPVQVTVIGQAVSTPIIPDIYQNPFNIGISVYTTAGTVASWAVEHTFDFTTVMSPTWNGSTGVQWFQNSGLGGTTGGTSVMPLNGNYAFAVAAIRLNVSSANATAVTVMNILQSVNSP